MYVKDLPAVGGKTHPVLLYRTALSNSWVPCTSESAVSKIWADTPNLAAAEVDAARVECALKWEMSIAVSKIWAVDTPNLAAETTAEVDAARVECALKWEMSIKPLK